MKMIQRFLAVALAMLAGISCVQAQGTAFSYNGRLNDGGTPANGSYDLRFSLCDAANNGSTIGSLTNTATGVSNGLFAVTLDFGGAFNGSNYWLELAARTNGGGAFTVLNPRQPVLPVPYAIYAANAGSAATASVADAVPAGNITGILAPSQLPDVVLTNNQNNVSLNGNFSGSHYGWGYYLTDLNPENFAPGNVKSALNLTNTMNTFNGNFNGTLNGYHSGDGTGLTNVPVDAVSGGLTANISVLTPGGTTNILCFTNGILRAIQ